MLKGWLLLACIPGTLLSLAWLSIRLSSAHPITGSLLVVCFVVVLGFVVSEPKDVVVWFADRLHDHHEIEGRFWALLFTVVFGAVVFGDSATLSFGWAHPTLGVVAVLAFAAWANNRQRQHRRRALRRRPQLKRTASWILGDYDRLLLAREQLKQIEEHIACIDVHVAPMKLCRQYRILQAEQAIVGTLRDSSAEGLNYLVSRLPLALVFYKVFYLTEYSNLSFEELFSDNI